MSGRTPAEQAFFDEINSALPEGRDWKLGAQTYVKQTVREMGAGNEQYLLAKPFLASDDKFIACRDFLVFINFLQLVNPSRAAHVLDIGCGPGWVSHYFAKFGIRSVGIDISEDMVALARRRVALDGVTAFPASPLEAEFHAHDIEVEPFVASSPFNIAIFEDTLHHFLDPVRVIQNVAQSLTDDAVLLIHEGVAPQPGTAWYEANHRLMHDYSTLERPFNRDQMRRMLTLAGFPHHRIVQPYNGLFDQSNDTSIHAFLEIKGLQSSNIAVAAKRPEVLDHLFDVQREYSGLAKFMRKLYFAVGRRCFQRYAAIAPEPFKNAGEKPSFRR
jgi:SAM-dependent methyltransferase